ncbi:BMC domain-containing protein [Enterococcus xiangfangensis]|uniref:BMC domain-containing protein n=1 Tax=Enterococcus xiangfangensis TaxID=1296537 RepID=A0ABU3F9H4_9ENTE|nr:BMC domain-containing protein [Enterococcus xiangfangensis]MBM7711532.1 microcompartment protein CcmL/EutN [Enterococcus xiangfangensis]MDT2759331.1 BMC domain-containing protein [Enterococcus xiangfangensis]NBK09528.1 BMC domain-containing protein [Enterococcus asini]
MNQALGLIEVVGYACAVNTADVMVKTANVSVIGIERAKGSGWLSIKVVGDVGAVNAAVESGKKIAQMHLKFVSAIVIPRMADGLSDIWLKNGIDASTESKRIKKSIAIESSVGEELVELASTLESKETTGHYTCNLCKDSACPRKKGEPRKVCIHYEELKNKE